ncbi:MAG TPA: cellulose-binding domain-containing protein [Actinoplanes sp.]|nr:cellulose-binding domain-containing protein [Actinoplanes sp.]
MLRELLTSAVAAVCAAGAITVAGPAAPAAAAACTGTIQITSLTFDPSPATPGQIATATVAAQNCTDQPQQASVMFVARFVGPSDQIPAGCPAIDPLPPQPASFAAGGTYTSGLGYLVFSGCTATALRVSVRFTDSTGAVLATQSADLPITQATPCAVTYRTSSQWSTGYVAQVGVANTGTAAINGWSLAFSYPGDQRITSGWNAAVKQTGAAVTAANLSYNASIAPGASVTFGVTGGWRVSNAAPTSFTLNGATCQTR